MSLFFNRNSENSSLNLVVSLLSRKICCKRFNRKYFSKETNNCSLKCNFKYKIKTKINKHLYCIYSCKWKYRMYHRTIKNKGQKELTTDVSTKFNHNIPAPLFRIYKIPAYFPFFTL